MRSESQDFALRTPQFAIKNPEGYMEKKKKATEYSIEIPKHDKYFFLIRKFLENIMALESITEKERDEIVLAVNEACDKLFRMDPDAEGNIKVDIKVKIHPKKITVVLHHKGTTELSWYFKKLSEDKLVMESVKGRIGDYLIEKSADEVSFSSSKRKGHQVKITKFRGK
jgi:anti-sigma regulatory factor (Ser/Thr protein kinase)